MARCFAVGVAKRAVRGLEQTPAKCAACTALEKRTGTFEGGATNKLAARRSSPARSANHNWAAG